jgi:hypothetical protein
LSGQAVGLSSEEDKSIINNNISSDFANEVSDYEIDISSARDAKFVNVADTVDFKTMMYGFKSEITDTMRNLIRTADIKFKVKNLRQATLSIEDIVNELGGYIESSNLSSFIERVTEQQISRDSAEYMKYYSLSNSMRIRIPNKQFNNLLKSLAPFVDYLDYRNISADNVTIDIISKNLTQKRSQLYSRRLQKSVDNKPNNKLEDIIDAENNMNYQREQEDAAKIEMLKLKNRIDLSTVSLQIYQNNIVYIEKAVISGSNNEYKLSFGNRMLNSLKNGYGMIECIVLLLADIWPILIIIALIPLLYKRYYKGKRNNNK